MAHFRGAVELLIFNVPHSKMCRTGPVFKGPCTPGGCKKDQMQLMSSRIMGKIECIVVAWKGYLERSLKTMLIFISE